MESEYLESMFVVVPKYASLSHTCTCIPEGLNYDTETMSATGTRNMNDWRRWWCPALHSVWNDCQLE
jgi:hypothetical protein